MGNYDDIIDREAPEPGSHPRMPIGARAAQFAPFASLVTFAGEIAATDREFSDRAVLSEESLEELNEALGGIAEKLPGAVPVRIIHYSPYEDGRAGGRYITETAVITRIDTARGEIRLADGSSLSFEDLYSLEEVTDDE